jgi:hypothetical protein
MFGTLELTKPKHSGEPEGDWVDFPASRDPDPWGALLRDANRLHPDVFGAQQGNARAESVAEKPMCSDRSRAKHHRSSGMPKRMGGVVMTFLAIALRGLLVTTTAVGIVAYLLLTNSHI